MRRILSLVVALVLVLGTVSVFAVSADWAGYYRVKYRSVSADPKASAADFETYMWQKLELFPSFTLSDNVKVSAGFFHQQYWGTGRLVNTTTGDPIAADPGGYMGPYSSTTSDNALINDQNVKTSLGVSAAWATLTFFEGKLGIDVGRRKNPEWGTGAFFGGPFNPDRIFITYKTPGMGGLMIPYFIYERRADFDKTYTGDNADQFLAGLIYVAPGKTLFGFTATYLKTGDNFTREGATASEVGGVAGVSLTDGQLYAADIYIDHKISMGEMSIKPIFEIVWAAGTIAKKGKHNYAANPTYNKDLVADVLNFILKAEVKLNSMLMITPEFAFQKAPTKATSEKMYSNFWGVNEYAGSKYTVGNIFVGFKGGSTLVTDYEIPSSYYGKLAIDADLDSVISGVSLYTWLIYAGVTGKSKTAGVETADSDKTSVLEWSIGGAYAIDKSTTFGVDFAYAKTGKGNAGVYNGMALETTYFYFGADLTVKF